MVTGTDVAGVDHVPVVVVPEKPELDVVKVMMLSMATAGDVLSWTLTSVSGALANWTVPVNGCVLVPCVALKVRLDTLIGASFATEVLIGVAVVVVTCAWTTLATARTANTAL